MIESFVAAASLPQTDPHQAAGIGQAEGRATLALLWPRAVRARQRRPGFLRRLKINSGIPGQSRWPVAYLLDVILNRDLWMHRVDLSRATGRPLVSGGHDQQIVAQVVRDLALGWSAAPMALELTGPAGGFWLLGSGDPGGGRPRRRRGLPARPVRPRRRRGAGADLRERDRTHPHPPGPRRLRIVWFMPSPGSGS